MFSDLINGKLNGIKELKLQNLGLKSLPNEVFELADTLEFIDLSGNQINELPKEFSKLTKLKIAFLSSNPFEVFPEILSQCPQLEMIGFKSCQISFVAENSFPSELKWLILTNNKIKKLPDSIGQNIKLQKCMLAGNELKNLPESMQNCKNIELLRLSANKFEKLPDWIWNLPRLAWLAYGANPCSIFSNAISSIPELDFSDFQIIEKIGEGASGIISKAVDNQTNNEVAIKIFKGNITSDGLPETELETCLKIGRHQNLIEIKGRINSPQLGTVMELLPSSFKNLGLPPTFETCTRDVFPKDKTFSYSQILKILNQVAEVCLHLHKNGIMHGDLYAHNILINDECDIKLGDFGAATTYDKKYSLQHQKLELRALGFLIDDLLSTIPIESKSQSIENELNTIVKNVFNSYF